MVGGTIPGVRTAIATDSLQDASNKRLPLIRMVRNERLPTFRLAMRRSDARSMARANMIPAGERVAAEELPSPLLTLWKAALSGSSDNTTDASSNKLAQQVLRGLGDALPEPVSVYGGLNDGTCSVAAYSAVEVDFGPCTLTRNSSSAACGMGVRADLSDQIRLAGSTTVVADTDGICTFQRLQIDPSNAQLLRPMVWVMRGFLRGFALEPLAFVGRFRSLQLQFAAPPPMELLPSSIRKPRPIAPAPIVKLITVPYDGGTSNSESPLLATGAPASCEASIAAIRFPDRMDEFDTDVNNGDQGAEGAELRLAGSTIVDVDLSTGAAIFDDLQVRAPFGASVKLQFRCIIADSGDSVPPLGQDALLVQRPVVSLSLDWKADMLPPDRMLYSTLVPAQLMLARTARLEAARAMMLSASTDPPLDGAGNELSREYMQLW